MFHPNHSLDRGPGHEPSVSVMNGIFRPNKSDNSEKLMVRVNQMNAHIENLKKSLSELEDKLKAYQNIIIEYESIFHEEISLYRLQKTKLAAMQEAFQDQESFTKEIEQQVSTFITKNTQQKDQLSSFKRIVHRFFHQNKFNQTNTNVKISEIEELITSKQKLLEKFQSDVKNWSKKVSISFAPAKASHINLN